MTTHLPPDDDLRDAATRQAERQGISKAWLAGPSDVENISSDDVARALANVHEQIAAGTTESIARSPSTRRVREFTTRSSAWRPIALAVGVVATLAVVVWRSVSTPTSTDIRTVTTRAGQRATLDLADGTHIVLAPQSTLHTNGTDVTLVGEAFFVSAHHARTPLVVHTAGVTTRVLGTQFGVRRYTSDAYTRVTVVEGKVSVGGARTVTVTAGQIAQATDSLATATTATVSSYTEWTSGQLVFHDVRADALLDAVGHWYGYEFRLADSTLASEPFTARFDGQQAADVLSAIRTLMNVTMSFDGHVVTLHRRARISRQARPRQEVDSFLNVTHEVGR